jgi:hypothetical protein
MLLIKAGTSDRDQRRRQRQVEPEDPPPEDALHERAAERRPERHGAAHRGGEDAESARALARREGTRQQRQRQWHDEGRAGALHAMRRNQQTRAWRERAADRPCYEQPHAKRTSAAGRTGRRAPRRSSRAQRR